MAETDITSLNHVFRALADETRRRVWLALGETPGATTAQLTARFPRLSRWSVMKHLAVMRDAGLVQTLPQGRARRHYRDERALAPIGDWLEDASSNG